MQRRQSVIYNLTSETVELEYPPEWRDGVPSSVQYDVWATSSSQDNTPAFTGSATTDAVAQTLGAAAGASQANPNRIQVASTADIIVGRYYRLGATTADHAELIKPITIVSSTLFDVEYPLTYDYASSGAVVGGLQSQFTVDATFVADRLNVDFTRNPFRVLWKYSVASKARRHLTFFDFVRNKVNHTVTPHDLIELQGDLMLEDGIERFHRYIKAAEVRVEADLEMRGVQTDRIRDKRLYNILIRTCALRVAAEDGLIPHNRDPEAVVDERHKQYSIDMENYARNIAQDRGLTGATTTGDRGRNKHRQTQEFSDPGPTGPR